MVLREGTLHEVIEKRNYASGQASLLGAEHKCHQYKALKPRQWLRPVATVDLREDLVEFWLMGYFAAQNTLSSQSFGAGACCVSLPCLKGEWPSCWIVYTIE